MQKTYQKPQTLFAGASPVKISVLPGRWPVLMEKGLAYTRKFSVLLCKYDHNSRYWKTSQTCLTVGGGSGLADFSGTWPRSGTMQNGIAYRLPSLVPRTYVTGCGLLPTPSKGCGRALGYPILSMWESWAMNGHQARSCHYLAALGWTAKQIVTAYEVMMGFPKRWTDLSD